VISDLTGDQFVDGADMAILDNNLYNYIGVGKPGSIDAVKKNIIKPGQERKINIFGGKEKINENKVNKK
jgi:hypothetical protein